MASTTQPRNVQAILMGTGQFSFCAGATSLADARAKGFRDFGNIQTVGLKPEVETVEHEGSYEGKKRVDKRWAIKGQIGYGLKCDEITRENLKIVLGGVNAAEPFTQPAINAVDGGKFEFGLPNSEAVINNWYDVVYSGKQVREITRLNLSTASAGTAITTVTESTDTFALSSHNLVNGDLIILGGSVVPSNLTANTIYYVVNSASGTFQIAATPGGAVVDFTTSGTSVTFRKVLKPEVDFVVDYKLGRVRFLTPQSDDITPIITANQISAGQTASLLGVIPLENLIQSGYGRLVIYDETHPNKVVYDHEGFSCQVSFSAAKEFDGKSPVDVDFDVLVTDEVGTVWSAE